MTEAFEKLVPIPLGNVDAIMRLILPQKALGIAIIIQGSRGISTHMDQIMDYMHAVGIGTLQCDMDWNAADFITQMDADISTLTERLITASEWLRSQAPCRELSIGYFCTGTGTAAAIQAAAALDQDIVAIASIEGRPDRADTEDLNRLKSPILLLVGEMDDTTLAMNQEAYSQMHCVRHISIIPGAHHLIEERASLVAAIKLATEWLLQYMTR